MSRVQRRVSARKRLRQLDRLEPLAQQIENFPARIDNMSDNVKQAMRATLEDKYLSRAGVTVAERHELRQELEKIGFGPTATRTDHRPKLPDPSAQATASAE